MDVLGNLIDESQIKFLLKILNKNSIKDITEEDILKVDNILIKDINQDYKSKINLISLFPNLKSVTLRNGDILNDFLNIISESKKIESLSFIDCDFSQSRFDDNLRIPNMLYFVHCSKLPERFPKTKFINIYMSQIDFNSIDFENVEIVDIQSSKILNASDLIKYKKIKMVNLDGSTLFEENGNIVSNIKVGSSVMYSHLEDENFKKIDESKDKYKNINDDINCER